MNDYFTRRIDSKINRHPGLQTERISNLLGNGDLTLDSECSWHTGPEFYQKLNGNTSARSRQVFDYPTAMGMTLRRFSCINGKQRLSS